ncbi:MAG: hypothetical protein ACW98X_06705 [Promethearchaeota archaeon]|jgi:hypothetical protein
MTKSEFYNVVEAKDLHVSIPHYSHFTIGTSPYYAHQHALGIDIYHSISLDNYEVLSPISGRISKIKTLLAPKPKFAAGIDKDYLILVKNSRNPNITYKILHVKPDNLQVGNRIEIGDSLGTTIRNGYFAIWSSPHLHLEIRPSHNAIRASGGKPFSLAFKNKKSYSYKKNGKTQEIPIKITSVLPEFLLGNFSEDMYKKFDPIYGVKVSVNQSEYILDGGIPHYKTGTIISSHKLERQVDKSIYLQGHKIGELNDSRGHFGFFKFDSSLNFFLNDQKIRGISLYLAVFIPLIKIIPYNYGQIKLSPQSIARLTITS